MEEITWDQVKGITNLILFEEFDFGIKELQMSNLIFENIKNISE